MLDINQLRRDLPSVIAKLEKRKNLSLIHI